ncbi:MAG: redoxin domain-containing protein [Saprospiraceae bacterium]|nr:redoxin domain-containing protein [Saprospiraceae bacterium]
MEVKIGEKAPLFSLIAYDKKPVDLEDFRGSNVVILFFPLAFSSVCTAELCQVRDELEDYNDLKANVLAISVDSLYTLRKFREEQGYNFTLLSDFNKEVSRSYGAFHEEFGLGMKGVSKRAAFVLDRNGIIKYKEILDIPSEIPNFEKIKETLASLN